MKNKRMVLLLAAAVSALPAFGASIRYTLPGEISSTRDSNGQLYVQIGGKLDVAAADKEYVRVRVFGDYEGNIRVDPFKLVLVSKDGTEYPAGSYFCKVGQIPAEVLVYGAPLKLQIDGGGGHVPTAGIYRVRIQVMATNPAGESYLLSSETTVTVKEPDQSSKAAAAIAPGTR
jgi:hypothetical protein